MAQAMSATANTAASESRPLAASAPATISVGIAGTGNPICSMKTLAKTIARPYWPTSEARSWGIRSLTWFEELELHSASDAPAAELKIHPQDDRAILRRQAVAEPVLRRGMGGASRHDRRRTHAPLAGRVEWLVAAHLFRADGRPDPVCADRAADAARLSPATSYRVRGPEPPDLRAPRAASQHLPS